MTTQGRINPETLSAFLEGLPDLLESLRAEGYGLGTRQHVAAHELAWACRDFAREQFGLMAGPVLAHWGIRRTEDIGRIVFTLVEIGMLSGNRTN